MESDSESNIMEDSTNDNEFEILDLTERGAARRSRKNLFRQLYDGTTSLSLESPVSQVAIGGASGWLTGFLFKKVSKATASAVGGGLVLLQIAYQSGYITINWKKVNRDAGTVQREVNRRISINRSSSGLKSFVTKLQNVVRNNAAISMGFSGGFLIGMAS